MDFLKWLFPPDSSTFWSALSAIFTGIAAFAIFMAKRQLKFEAWLKAQDLFTEKKFVDARGVVYSLKGRPYNSWSTDETENAMLVCRKMDELAHLIPYLGKKKVLDVWDNPIARTWSILEDFIKYERSPSKANWQQKWFAFENIAKKAINRVK